ncbi:MAG: hypothetical protein ABIN37_18515 [Burkholderiaceae bacterium]
MDKRRRGLLLCLAGPVVMGPMAHAQPAGPFDHTYAAWDVLLKRHVRWLPDNKQSRVDYKAFLVERPALKKFWPTGLP